MIIWPNSPLLLSQNHSTMEKIFQSDATVKGTIMYDTNGTISITPNGKTAKDITKGKTIRQRGVCFTDQTGASSFVPYNQNIDKHVYTKLFATTNGIVYSTVRRNLVVKMTIQSGISQQEMARIIRDEIAQIIVFIKSKEGKEALK